MLRQTYCPEWPDSAICVQRLDDSRNSAIHITFRISLRSSSLQEPRDPLLKVVLTLIVFPTGRQTNSRRLRSAVSPSSAQTHYLDSGQTEQDKNSQPDIKNTVHRETIQEN